MKLDAIDHRKPVTVNLKLDAATYDLAQRYKEYAATLGQQFNTDGQLMGAVILAFFKKGDPDFARWLRLQHHPAPKIEKKTKQKANGVDLSAPAKFSVDDVQK
jgi:hypothetical protein